MLTLFILKTGKPDADSTDLVKLFNPTRWQDINNLSEIEGVTTKWYGVMYDDELIDEQLKAALAHFLYLSFNDILMMYKNTLDGKMEMTCRLFKSYIKLKKDCLIPANETFTVDNILNGWIYDRDKV